MKKTLTVKKINRKSPIKVQVEVKRKRITKKELNSAIAIATGIIIIDNKTNKLYAPNFIKLLDIKIKKQK